MPTISTIGSQILQTVQAFFNRIFHPPKPTRLLSLILALVGFSALISSTILSSAILAFIGLSITFWGALLFYIRNEKYVKTDFLEPSIFPLLANLSQILTEKGYRGKPIYLPPKYFKNTSTCKVYIPKNKKAKLPSPLDIQKEENRTFLEEQKAAFITPPGLHLSKLIKKNFGKKSSQISLKFLQRKLSELLEDLEIVENLEFQTAHDGSGREIAGLFSLKTTSLDKIIVKLTNLVYMQVCGEISKLSPLSSAIGCPLCSALACIIAEASNKIVCIEKTEFKENGRIIIVHFCLIEE